MVRTATIEDLTVLVGMGRDFHEYAAAQNNLNCNISDFSNYIKFMIDSDFTTILVDEKITGSIAGIISPWFMDFSQKIVTEQWWWVDPSYRDTKVAFELLEALTNWGKQSGASKLIMVSINSKKEKAVKRYYGRKGFRYMETNFIKDI